MEFVYEQTRDSDSLVLLSDAQGLLLDTLGDAGFVNRAERVALGLAAGAAPRRRERRSTA